MKMRYNLLLTAQVLLLILKIAKVVAWSWWLVFIPTYAFVLLFGVTALMFFLVLRKGF